MNEGDHILMTELIAQRKEYTAKMAAAEKEMGLWIERMKLAQDAGKPQLFEAARERARRHREDVRAAESVLMDLDVQMSKLKREVRSGKTSEGARSVARAQAMLKSLEGTPMDPRDAKFEKLEKKAAADDALAALKDKMGLD